MTSHQHDINVPTAESLRENILNELIVQRKRHYLEQNDYGNGFFHIMGPLSRTNSAMRQHVVNNILSRYKEMFRLGQKRESCHCVVLSSNYEIEPEYIFSPVYPYDAVARSMAKLSDSFWEEIITLMATKGYTIELMECKKTGRGTDKEQWEVTLSLSFEDCESKRSGAGASANTGADKTVTGCHHCGSVDSQPRAFWFTRRPLGGYVFLEGDEESVDTITVDFCEHCYSIVRDRSTIGWERADALECLEILSSDEKNTRVNYDEDNVSSGNYSPGQPLRRIPDIKLLISETKVEVYQELGHRLNRREKWSENKSINFRSFLDTLYYSDNQLTKFYIDLIVGQTKMMLQNKGIGENTITFSYDYPNNTGLDHHSTVNGLVNPKTKKHDFLTRYEAGLNRSPDGTERSVSFWEKLRELVHSKGYRFIVQSQDERGGVMMVWIPSLLDKYSYHLEPLNVSSEWCHYQQEQTANDSRCGQKRKTRRGKRRTRRGKRTITPRDEGTSP